MKKRRDQQRFKCPHCTLNKLMSAYEVSLHLSQHTQKQDEAERELSATLESFAAADARGKGIYAAPPPEDGTPTTGASICPHLRQNPVYVMVDGEYREVGIECDDCQRTIMTKGRGPVPPTGEQGQGENGLSSKLRALAKSQASLYPNERELLVQAADALAAPPEPDVRVIDKLERVRVLLAGICVTEPMRSRAYTLTRQAIAILRGTR